jgi:hypothetical protein
MTLFGKRLLFTDRVPILGARNRRRLERKAEEQFAERVDRCRARNPIRINPDGTWGPATPEATPEILLHDFREYRPDARFID